MSGIVIIQQLVIDWLERPREKDYWSDMDCEQRDLRAWGRGRDKDDQIRVYSQH